MIIGTGIDMVELARIQRLMEEKPSFVRRILTAAECEKWDSLSPKRKVEYLAGRFAAKEAYAKASGLGIGKRLSFQDITVTNTEHGKPVLNVEGVADTLHVSISHCKTYAVAHVLIEQK